MDLRYSAADEAFRAELRTWLEREVARHGPPPGNEDWPARRVYDTVWQRKLYDVGTPGWHGHRHSAGGGRLSRSSWCT